MIEALKGVQGKRPELRFILVHTGQHYDDRMSRAFFDALGLPHPDVNLEVGSGGHAEQTGRVMIAFEALLLQEEPDWVVVMGDVNSTMACTIAAKKLGIKVAHVEAGLRSRDRTMPEEINRVVTDVLCDILFTTDPMASANLKAEVIASARVHFVGNVMIDTLLKHRELARCLRQWERFGLQAVSYGVLTLPGHPLGPLHHGLCIAQLRPMPLPLQETPAPLDGLIFAVVRRIVQSLHRLVNVVGERHHARQKWRTPATALRAMIHVDVQPTRGGLLVFIPGVPPGCERIPDAVTRLVGTAKGESQLGALVIDASTRDILLLAPPLMSTGLLVAPGETAARIIAAGHSLFPSDAQAFDAAGCHGVGICFFYGRRSRRSL